MSLDKDRPVAATVARRRGRIVTGDRDNVETWNTCPDCGQMWADPQPTPGVVHRVRLCVGCGGVGRTGGAR